MASPWPPSSSQGPRRRLDARWLTVVVIAVIILVVLVRQHRIHITEAEVLFFVAIIPSIILHEVTHGWVALAFGDDTAKRAGRLSLNPVVHVSVFGTIIVPIVLVLLGLPPFGWAKPVPVNISTLRHPRNESVVVALSGPAMNVLIAVVAGLLFRAVLPTVSASATSLPVGEQFLLALGEVNVFLAVFNLIPIPPLDGSSVVERLLPREWLPGYLAIRPYTIFLPFLVLWLYPQWLDDLFQPFLNLWAHLL